MHSTRKKSLKACENELRILAHQARELSCGHGVNLNESLLNAARCGYHSVVYGLVRRPGVNVNHQECHGGATALIEACSIPHYGMVADLLANGARPNLSDARGNTPLMVASGTDNAEDVVRLLVRNGARLTDRNCGGVCALDMAKWSGQLKTAKFLRGYASADCAELSCSR